MSKDPRPNTYCYTKERTIRQLTREELETALCDAIDAQEQMATICANMFENAAEQLPDDFFTKRFK